MKREQYSSLETHLYNEWAEARKRAERYQEFVDSDVTGHKTVEYYKRLAQVEWKNALDILEIIYDFEKERVS